MRKIHSADWDLVLLIAAGAMFYLALFLGAIYGGYGGSGGTMSPPF